MEKIQNLLKKVSQNILVLKTAQSLYSQKLAPNFITFDYMDTSELGLSRILADLLNPRGNHGQQHHFPELFIKQCLPSLIKQPKWQSFIENLDNAHVSIEEVTYKIHGLRRMDVYISYVANEITYGICIENKPFASDQPNQLLDYAKELKSRHGDNWHIVYISEYKDNPSEYSIDKVTKDIWLKNEQLTILKYSSLIEWLNLCQVKSQNHSVTEFLSQFTTFIQQRFMGIEDMNETYKILNSMIQNNDSIEASIKISNSLELMKQQLIEKLKNDLMKHFSENDKYNSDLELDLDCIGKGNNYEQINFIIKEYNKAYISFEFQSPNYDKPYIGIKFVSADEFKACPFSTKMKVVLNEKLPSQKISSTDLWPAGYWFNHKDWKNSPEPWQLIKNDEMAKIILAEMYTIYKTLKDGGCLELY